MEEQKIPEKLPIYGIHLDIDKAILVNLVILVILGKVLHGLEFTQTCSELDSRSNRANLLL